MKSRKAQGPTGMTRHLMKRADITGALTRVFSGIVDEGKFSKTGKTVRLFRFIKEKKKILWSVENIEELDYWNME